MQRFLGLGLLATALGCGPPWPRSDVDHREVVWEELGDTYEVSIHVPPELRGVYDKPWLLVLDGQSGYTEARWSDWLIQRGEAAPHVIVGIGNDDLRDRDYTPTAWTGDGDAEDVETGGWADFAAWLEADLMPELEGELGLSSDRADRGIHGHSYGGLATSVAMFEQTHVWSRFGATSPSLFWDDGHALALLDQHVAAGEPLEARVYASMGALEVTPMNLFFDAFTERLPGVDPDGVVLEAEVFAHHEHFSSWEPAYAALVPHLFPPE